MDQRMVGLGSLGTGIVLLIIFIMLKSAFDVHAIFMCEAVAADPDTSMSACPAHAPAPGWALTVGFGVSALLIVIGGFLLIPQKGDASIRRMDTALFDEDERVIYDMVFAKDGSMYQSDIVKESGFGKVKVTRVLDSLESKGVLERKRRGMTNLVVLKG